MRLGVSLDYPACYETHSRQQCKKLCRYKVDGNYCFSISSRSFCPVLNKDDTFDVFPRQTRHKHHLKSPKSTNIARNCSLAIRCLSLQLAFWTISEFLRRPDFRNCRNWLGNIQLFKNSLERTSKEIRFGDDFHGYAVDATEKPVGRRVEK